MREQIGKVTLDDTWYPGEDYYSDGPVEEELLQIAKSVSSEAEYNRIIAKKKSWPILYHFSHIRHNIVSWIPMGEKDRVLEIGAGCGAITGALARKAGSVTCVELSKKRSLINAYRNRQYGNIEILVGAFEEVERHLLKDSYQFITLIGVFEYAACYTDHEKPFHYMLSLIREHLAPGGKVVLAIENRLGLKYFAGCAEDHVGRYFEGIEGYPNTTDVHTFSKRELTKLFDEVGGYEYRSYYPYPDYKFPYSIYSDHYLPRKGELKDNRCNYDQRRLGLFDEARVFDSLIDNELFPEFSNSFLVLLERKSL